LYSFRSLSGGAAFDCGENIHKKIVDVKRNFAKNIYFANSENIFNANIEIISRIAKFFWILSIRLRKLVASAI